MRWFLRIFGDLRHGPLACGAQSLVGHGATRLADGRQPIDRPILRAVVAKLSHQETEIPMNRGWTDWHKKGYNPTK